MSEPAPTWGDLTPAQRDGSPTPVPGDAAEPRRPAPPPPHAGPPPAAPAGIPGSGEVQDPAAPAGPALSLEPPAEPLLEEETLRALHGAVEACRHDSTYLYALSGGGPVAELEQEFARQVGARHALALSSGTAALFTALAACGVAPGDEVILPCYTWGQSLAPVLHLGAVPVFADIEPRRGTLDPRQVERLVTPRTRAVLAVHLFGMPADLPALSALCRHHNLALVEDAAQAFGARVEGRPVGGWGDAAGFSLGKGKPVTGGEGGLLCTNRWEVFERAVALSQHPLRQAWELGPARRAPATRDARADNPAPLDWRHTLLGGSRRGVCLAWNFRPHALAAVIALAELRYGEQHRRRRADYYQALSHALEGVAGLRPPLCPPGVESAWYRYCPTYAPQEVGQGDVPRAAFVEALAARGVPLGEDPLPVPLDQDPAVRRLRGSARWGRLPHSHARAWRVGLSLPDWLPGCPQASPRALRAACLQAVADLGG